MTLWLLTLCTLTGLTACEEDDWYYTDDNWAAETLVGQWEIVETSPMSGSCPYRRGDLMQFYANGIMQSYGYNLNETGYWDIRLRRIRIDFDRDGLSDLQAYIDQMDDRYLVLTVTDYAYNSSYRLRLVYAGLYTAAKRPAGTTDAPATTAETPRGH